MTDGPNRRSSMRSYRRRVILSGQWTHIAWVWGPREVPYFARGRPVATYTTRIYVNGDLAGESHGFTGPLPAQLR